MSIQVNGVDDLIRDGNIDVNIVVSVVDSLFDDSFDNLPDTSITVRNLDDDPENCFNRDFNENELKCQYCNKFFSTKAHKRRHEIHRCNENPNIITSNGRRINY